MAHEKIFSTFASANFLGTPPPLYPMNPIQKNNVSLWGNDNASATIVFVHGFGTDQSAWRFVREVFAERYRLVFLDLVGAGEKTLASYSSEHYPSYHPFAQDITDVAKSLGLQDAMLIGHSMGAMISLLAALKHPTAFSALAMIGASPYYLNDGEYVGGFSQEELDALLSAMETNYYGWVSGFAPLAMGVPEDAGSGNLFAESLLQMRPDVALSILKTVFRSDHRADVMRSSIPTLALHAKDDKIVPEGVGLYLERAMPNCTRRVISAFGHLPHITAPEETARHLLAFCDAHRQG